MKALMQKVKTRPLAKLMLLTAVVSTVACTQSKVSKPDTSATNPGIDFVKNELVVQGDRAEVDSYFKAQGITASFSALDDDIYHVRYKGEVGELNLVGEVAKLKSVKFVEPNYKINPLYSKNIRSWPKDRLFFKQWYLNNVGQPAPFGIGGKRGSDIGALKAWKVTKGSKNVLVAVIDTGVDYTHPDLKENMWVNEAERDGVPGIDDDQNGFVDDVYGFDFYSSEGSKTWYGQPGDPDPMDEGGHGTHVAGTIGAKSNNNIGVAGVANEVSIMAIRFLGPGGGTSTDAYRAIKYAVKMKAHIISNSWGGGAENKLIQVAIDQANEAGALFIAAAGNEGNNNDVQPVYPASYTEAGSGQRFSNILTVGASDNNDNPAFFSNYGHENVDIFAPGVAIASTYPQSLLPPGVPPYAVMSGTSMATPVVTGVAALMMANNPGLIGNPQKVREILMMTADTKRQLIGKAASGGRVNAYRALTYQTSDQQNLAWMEKPYTLVEQKYHEELVDIRKEISVPGAKAVRVHFQVAQINEPYDSLYFYDKDWNYVGKLENSQTVDYWSPTVPGDTIRVRFVNSKLRRIKFNPMAMLSQSDCTKGGGTMIFMNNVPNCQMDSPFSDERGVEEYVSYNSEGYVIDKVGYLQSQD